MNNDSKARLQALLDAALAPLKKQLDEHATRLEKFDVPAGTEVLRKVDKPWQPITPLTKVNGFHTKPEVLQ